VLDTLDDAVVCGHSYGGAVVTEGAAGHPAARHLVFLAAFPLQPGEAPANAAPDAAAREDGASELGEAMIAHEDGTFTLDPERAVSGLYADCEPDDAAKAAARLGPQPVATLRGVATRAAWHDIPSTYVVCSQDRAVGPGLQRVLARRCTRTIEWPTSHSPFLSRPELVADLLIELAGDLTTATQGVAMADATDQTEYQEQAQSALEKIKTQIDELRVQADLAQAEARDRLQQGVEALRKRQGEAKTKLDEAQKAGTGAWKSVAKQTEQVVADLGDAFSKLAGEVQSAAGAAGTAANKGREAFLEEWHKARDARQKLLGK
jgi:hypothetical protein